MVAVKKHVRLITAFENIVWDVFFASRNRGVSLLRHFPWMFADDKLSYYMLAEREGEIIGGLAVREVKRKAGDTGCKIGMVGLVCVSPLFRGTGVAKKLLTETLRQAEIDGFDALTLWTTKPKLYTRYGFTSIDRWEYGWARKQQSEILADDGGRVGAPSLLETFDTPLPPFALSTYELRDSHFTVSLAKDATGWIALGYTGNAAAVARSLDNSLPNNWRVNVEHRDPLTDELEKIGYALELKAVNLQMWCCISNVVSAETLANAIRIPISERI